jgi:hypothetical protein
MFNKLGVYVDGKLKYQSRDHESIYAYAEDEMNKRRSNVWVAPVGSFVTEENVSKRRAKAASQIAKA